MINRIYSIFNPINLIVDVKNQEEKLEVTHANYSLVDKQYYYYHILNFNL